MAEPLDACSPLTNEIEAAKNGTSPFALVIRGGCSFEDKVRRAQTAGFKAVIVYDNVDDGVLVASNHLSVIHMNSLNISIVSFIVFLIELLYCVSCGCFFIQK